MKQYFYPDDHKPIFSIIIYEYILLYAKVLQYIKKGLNLVIDKNSIKIKM